MRGQIILENAKFMWQSEEIKRFRELWAEKLSVHQIAEAMNENPDDIALLIMDQAQKGKI